MARGKGACGRWWASAGPSVCPSGLSCSAQRSFERTVAAWPACALGPQAVFEEPRRKGRFTLGPLVIIQKKRQLVRATPSKEGGETSHPDLITPRGRQTALSTHVETEAQRGVACPADWKPELEPGWASVSFSSAPNMAPKCQSPIPLSDSCQPSVPLSHCVPGLGGGGSLSVSSPCGGSVLEVHVGAEPLQPWGARFSPRVLSVIRRNERRFRISGETWGQAVHVSGRQDREGATATASGTSVCVGALLSSGSSIAYLGHSPSFIINKQLLGAGLSRHWEQLWPRRGSSRACALVGTGVRQWACRNDGGGGCYFHLEPGAGHQLGDLLDLEFTFQPCARLIV